MKTAVVGRTGVRVSALGFGAADIGNLYTAIDPEVARSTVDAAWEAGVRYFDTAPHYGLGLSERRLGEALRDRPRDEYTVSTKVGRLLVPNPAGGGRRDAEFDVPADLTRRFDFSADGVRRSLESSVDRLGLSHVDIALMHDPDEHWEQAISEAYPALHELRAQGVVRAIGVGMNQWPMLARFVRETDLDVVMLASRYTLLEQPALRALLPACAQRCVSVLAAGVFNSGLLAVDDPAPDARYDYRPAPPEVREKALRIKEICALHGVSLPGAAIAFVLAHPAVVSAVVGTRSPEQARRNVALCDAGVPPELWTDLAAKGLIP
ncbi:D-threo-aldose 1-dehydrogenase [Herbihabitans rhizosphaerae]|uniref:D-threo-aldose 1-dehydrogenase n=1 Tax=Herbihabitans rhizosphaerae TaxID=1872711 RepID=A0A4Q7KIW8_9PSEU|nr:aldo/keto reductase [Herbihabitans rhizosphaerae]RZS36508.1 D-threo-aldose 1-dehydrogenase [Herbihabitans rhizosphaerae]